MNTSRREFLQLSALLGAGAMFMPSALWAAGQAKKSNRRLVLLFLDGGNDGLNTVVPYADDLYRKARPKLGLAADQIIALNATVGLNAQLSAWQSIFDEGKLSILQGVGYDRPNLSHFTSRDIWHSGKRESEERPSGWIGRCFEAQSEAGGLPPVAMGTSESPLLLKSASTSGLTLTNLAKLSLDRTPEVPGAGLQGGPLARIGQASQMAYETADQLRAAAEKVPAGEGYPDTALGDRLRLAARLVRAENGPPVCWSKLGGFDTHALQLGTHNGLLRQLGDATAAFQADLASDGADENTLLLIYSEFGRRVSENGSSGTDHGAAGPMFAIGGGLNGGLLGANPNLADLDEGNLKMQTDYRAVFSEVLRDWMGWPSENIFDGAFSKGDATVGLIRAKA